MWKKEITVEDAIVSGQYYVYLLCTEGGTPFYVGKGKDFRIYTHIVAARRGEKSEKARKIRQLLENNERICFKIDSIHIEENEAYMRENQLINQYSHLLANGYHHPRRENIMQELTEIKGLLNRLLSGGSLPPQAQAQIKQAVDLNIVSQLGI